MPHIFQDPGRAKEILTNSKPQSAVTGWIDRICDPDRNLSESDTHDFLIELVETINLQATGPEEASRALRKKLKHGSVAQQRLALVILESLVLNAGDRFRTTFADDRLVESIKSLIFDSRTDRIVRRRLLLILADWEERYSPNPQMNNVSGLFKACRGHSQSARASLGTDDTSIMRAMITGIETNYVTQEPTTAQRKNSLSVTGKKHETEKKMKKQFRRRSSIDQTYRKELVMPASRMIVTDLVNDKATILQALAIGSQRANHLVNSLQLVDSSKVNVRTDPSIQAHLEKARTTQRTLIRYIGIATDRDSAGEYLGTLINTNNQIVNALELYELMAKPITDSEQISALNDRIRTRSGTTTTRTDSRDDEQTDAGDIFDDSYESPSVVDHSSRLNGLEEDLLGLDFSINDALKAPIEPDCLSDRRNKQMGGYTLTRTLSEYSDYELSSSNNSSDHTSPKSNNPFYKSQPKSSLNPFDDPLLSS